MGKNKLPDRWTAYSPVGKRLPGTRFISFKVPLKKSFEAKLNPEQYFSPNNLIEKIKEQDEEIGLIVDLTCTTRYYPPAELPENIFYFKIFTVGHEVPENKTILEFKRAVRTFLRENADNDKLIGVHCTHGVNRTGYLVCRYLIDVYGMDPSAAIELFNSSRGHRLERQNYIDDLRKGPKRSNDGMDAPGLQLKPGQAFIAEDFQGPRNTTSTYPKSDWPGAYRQQSAKQRAPYARNYSHSQHNGYGPPDYQPRYNPYYRNDMNWTRTHWGSGHGPPSAGNGFAEPCPFQDYRSHNGQNYSWQSSYPPPPGGTGAYRGNNKYHYRKK